MTALLEYLSLLQYSKHCSRIPILLHNASGITTIEATSFLFVLFLFCRTTLLADEVR